MYAFIASGLLEWLLLGVTFTSIMHPINNYIGNLQTRKNARKLSQGA